MDENIEQIGGAAPTIVRQNAFWFAFLVPIFVVSVLPIAGPGQVLVLAVIYLGEGIVYAIRRSRSSS